MKPLGVTENEIATIKQCYFEDLSFSNISSTKIDYSSRKMFENKLVNSILENWIHLLSSTHYWLLFFKNDNFKYTTTSQRRYFNLLSLFDIFSSHRPLFCISFHSHAQRKIIPVIYIAYHVLWVFAM